MNINIPQDQFLTCIASRVTAKTSVTPEVKASKSLPIALLRTRRKRCLPFSSLVEHRSNIDCRNDVSLPADRSVSLIPVYARKILRISAHTRSIDRSINRTDRSIHR